MLTVLVWLKPLIIELHLVQSPVRSKAPPVTVPFRYSPVTFIRRQFILHPAPRPVPQNTIPYPALESPLSFLSCTVNFLKLFPVFVNGLNQMASKPSKPQFCHITCHYFFFVKLLVLHCQFLALNKSYYLIQDTG